MKYFVYILESIKNGRRYVGYTSRNVNIRLKEHNIGKNKWTRENKPFNLIYYEELSCKQCAIKRELFWKSGQGRKLSKLFSKSA